MKGIKLNRGAQQLERHSYVPAADASNYFTGFYNFLESTPSDPIKMTVMKSKHYKSSSPTKTAIFSLGEASFGHGTSVP